jgi:hypothetical protein
LNASLQTNTLTLGTGTGKLFTTHLRHVLPGGAKPKNKEILWESIESLLHAQRDLIPYEDRKLELELKYRTLLKTYGAFHGLIPQRWQDETTTWLPSPVALKCKNCGSIPDVYLRAETEFVGSSVPGYQLSCGGGCTGPHGICEADAITRWNYVIAEKLC